MALGRCRLTGHRCTPQVIHNVNKRHAIDCIATFCGAHAVPPGRTPETQTKDVIEHQIPALEVSHIRVAGAASSVGHVTCACVCACLRAGAATCR